ncbi:MAG: ribbon-helix-helix domain-containing protein [Deltaproteobacteria bacterium]|nr:ribbon-helix-helix domain-containing protein [Deltaproteobacteria bacterium]
MRTTLTLDEDVAAKLKEAAQKSGLSFKETVNSTLRKGLNSPQPPGQLTPFKVRARALGGRPGVDFDNIGELLHRQDEPYGL